MNIKLEPIGILKQYCQNSLTSDNCIPLAEDKVGQCLETVCLQTGLPPEIISLYIVNDQIQPKNYRIQAGDHIKCVAIIGGG